MPEETMRLSDILIDLIVILVVVAIPCISRVNLNSNNEYQDTCFEWNNSEMCYRSSALWHNNNDAVFDGDYVYYIASNGLIILDIADTSNPVLRSQLHMPHSHNIALSGNYVMVTGDSILRVVDISDPDNPREEAEFLHPGEELQIIDDYAYMACYDSGLLILDVSIPVVPALEGEFTKDGYKIVDFDVQGDSAYILVRDIDSPCGDDSLLIVNTNDKTNPIQVSAYGSGASFQDVGISGRFAYLTFAFNPDLEFEGGLLQVDLLIPDSIGSFAIPNARDVKIANDRIYMTNSGPEFRGMLIFEKAYLNPLDTIASYPISQYPKLLAVGAIKALLYGAYPSRMEIVNIENPNDPTLAGSYFTGGELVSQQIVGNYAYIASDDGLQIIDVDDKYNPRRVGYYLVQEAQAVAVEGDYAYLGTDGYGLHKVHISSPESPSGIDTVFIGYDITDVETYLDYVLLAANESGLLVVNKDNFSDLFSFPIYAHCVTVDGEYAYIGYDEYLYIVDLSNCPTLNISGSCDGLKWPNDIAVNDGLAYVASYNKGLQVIDITDKGNPDTISSYTYIYYNAQAVIILDEYALLADDYLGLMVIDVSDSYEPYLEAVYNVFVDLMDIYIANNFLYLADEYGFYIYQLYATTDIEEERRTHPRELRLSQNYPNPFNPATVIEYSLSQRCHVTMEVYNSIGQLVRRLVNKYQPAGTYYVTWDGKDAFGKSAASGIYFCSIKTDRFAESKKMILLK
jgi:hypothetical protein